MKQMTFPLPFLPPSLNAYRNDHWRKQRNEEKTWKDYVAVKWAELGRPKMQAVRITLIFSFPDRRTRDLDNYLATGSKLVGDAVKGFFIPDDSPDHLKAWSFRFEFGQDARTTVVIEEADEDGMRCDSMEQTGFREELSFQPGKEVAGAGGDAGSATGRYIPSDRLSGRQAVEVETAEGRPSCTLYEDCIAPLCPLDGSSLRGVWYSDEEICRSRSQGNLLWVKAQRKVAKVAAPGYFTVGMLNGLAVIRKGLAGFDPDLLEAPQLRSWLQRRANRLDVPPEEKTSRTSHLKKYRFQKQVDGEG